MVRSFTHDGPGTPASEWADRPEWEHVPSAELDGFDHVLVVAAHPDDETLGAGGLIATAAAADLDVHLFVCTAGEHSHPNSTTHRPEDLATRRENEVRAALGELAPGAGITLLNVQDGHLDEHEQTLVALLVRLIKDGRRTLIVAPWRHDGHPDHDAAGRAAATTAHRTGATLWEYPIWWWHWAQPGEAPWDDLRQLDLTDTATRRRRRALTHHRSQTEPLSDAPGDEALLRPHFVQHFTGPRERFILQETPDDSLDRLHRAEPDPWGVDERRYERRKRALSLAMLPRDRFTRGLEIGCSVGALTADLAQHCDALVALDSSNSAVESARQRLAVDSSDEPGGGASRGGARRLAGRSLRPVVVSEIGYFLSPRDLDDLARAHPGVAHPGRRPAAVSLASPRRRMGAQRRAGAHRCREGAPSAGAGALLRTGLRSARAVRRHGLAGRRRMTVPTPFAVHVVIPAHNEAALIGRCLTSVRDAAAHLLDSTGVAATVTVVADSCTDSTVEVARQYGVEVLILQARCVGRARDAGVRHVLAASRPSDGSRVWIAMTDADSTVTPDWLEVPASVGDRRDRPLDRVGAAGPR